MVVSKLAIQFVEDLGEFAAAISKILNSSGVLIVSVPHPVHAAKQVSSYWKETEYRQQIGKYGIYDTVVHRSIGQYADIFSSAGFAITGISEPAVSERHLQ
ncbi:MAG TPA: hypothetical protein VJ836_07980 [Candidatus Saccharimonadales bacterium]|nr:hypothetical protein [Candidatus Saccharimonadales bacterium]